MADHPRDLARTMLAVLFIGGLIAACFQVIQPFLAAIVWATTLVIATWPLMLAVEAAVGRRRWLAVTVMTLGLLVVVLLPLAIAIDAIVAHSDEIGSLLVAAPNLRLPHPPDWLADVPVVGARAAEQWRRLADAGLADLLLLVKPYIGTATRWFVGAAGSIGGLVVHLLLTIAIAAVLYATGEPAAAWCRRFGRRLASRQGEEAVVLVGLAIRSVALGVVVTAVAQTVVAGLGMMIAGVPQAGLLSAVVLLLCIAQLGPALVMIPATIWLFVVGTAGPGIVLAGFTAAALLLDNVLRPVLIRQGADLPLLLILTGVIGGMLSYGLLGLFLGPVLLGVAYTLLQHWMSEAE
jgi:predicted PurR-regulated permease PerM